MCVMCNCIGPDAQVCREENVAHTRMNAENIAMVFAPNVLRSSISDPNQVQHGNDRTRATCRTHLLQRCTNRPCERQR